MNPQGPPSHGWEVKGPSAPFPYIPGFSVKIRPYTPPTETQTQADAEESLKPRYPSGIRDISAVEYCIVKPYFELETGLFPEAGHLAREHILRVDSITTRPASDVWWNVVQCQLDDDRKSRYTAKIYDPVYSSDVMFAHMHANDHINNEADAYSRVRDAGIPGRVTPVFLGVWVMDVPVPSKSFGGVDYATTRPVPLLLFEEVEAANLASTYLQNYYTSGYVESQPQLPRAWRQEVLAKIYEAKALLCHAGVYAPVSMDGVLVGTSVLEDGRLDVRVFITDFEQARIADPEECTGETPERPVSPIETYWDKVMHSASWLAKDEWAEDVRGYRQWLVQRWGESTEYRPLSEELRKRIADGKWEEMSRS